MSIRKAQRIKHQELKDFSLKMVRKTLSLCTKFVAQKPSNGLFLIITWLFADTAVLWCWPSFLLCLEQPSTKVSRLWGSAEQPGLLSNLPITYTASWTLSLTPESICRTAGNFGVFFQLLWIRRIWPTQFSHIVYHFFFFFLVTYHIILNASCSLATKLTGSITKNSKRKWGDTGKC